MRTRERMLGRSGLAIVAAAGALSLGIGLAGCGGGGSGGSAATPAPATAAAATTAATPTPAAASGAQAAGVPTTKGSLGQDIYFRACARCHGDNMEGKDDTPKLDRVRVASIGDQALEITIQTGKGKMPAFGRLSLEQIDAVIAYLRAVAI